jgi:hypothetical protein
MHERPLLWLGLRWDALRRKPVRHVEAVVEKRAHVLCAVELL